MNKCWYHLNLDNSFALLPDLRTHNGLVEHFEPTGPINLFTLLKEDLPTLVTNEWLDYMKSLDLELTQCLVFYRLPGAHHPFAHVDQPRTQSKLGVTINWTLNDTDGAMVWYDATNSPGIQQQEFNTQYVLWPEETLTEIDRCVITNQPTLVRTDIPHNVFIGSNPRWAFSFRCSIRPGTWEENVHRVKHLII